MTGTVRDAAKARQGKVAATGLLAIIDPREIISLPSNVHPHSIWLPPQGGNWQFNVTQLQARLESPDTSFLNHELSRQAMVGSAHNNCGCDIRLMPSALDSRLETRARVFPIAPAMPCNVSTISRSNPQNEAFEKGQAIQTSYPPHGLFDPLSPDHPPAVARHARRSHLPPAPPSPASARTHQLRQRWAPALEE